MGGPVIAKVKQYANCTSCHGLSAAILSRGGAKVLWVTVFLTSLAFCSYQIVMIFISYFGYPVQYNVQLQYGQLNFPAVTICNWNPYMTSKIKQNRDLNAVISYLDGLSAGTILPPSYSAATARKRRAVQWVDNLMLDHVMHNLQTTDDPTQFIAESTRSAIIGQAAKYLIDHIPKGSELLEQKRSVLRTFVSLANSNDAFPGQTITAVKQNKSKAIAVAYSGKPNGEVSETSAESGSSLTDTSEKRSKRAPADDCCTPNCQVDSVGQYCYLVNAGSYSHTTATSMCAINAASRIPRFASATEFNNYMAVRNIIAPLSTLWIGYSNAAAHSAGIPGIWTSASGNWPNYVSWAAGEPSGSSSYMAISTVSGNASAMDSSSASVMCQCTYCCADLVPGTGMTITYSTLTGKYRGPGQTATITCATGYTLAGSSVQTCGTAGSWSPSPPPTTTCNPPCPAVTLNAGVVISYSSPYKSVGSTYSWSCASGYSPYTGPGTPTCNAVSPGVSSAWSNTAVPVCKPPCNFTVIATPGVIMNYSDPYMTVGSTATWSCEPPYSPINVPVTSTCVFTNPISYWSPAPNDGCFPPCTAWPMPEIGFANVSYNSSTGILDANGTALFMHGTMATIDCQQFVSNIGYYYNDTTLTNWTAPQTGVTGYTLTGTANNSVACLNGVWSPTVDCTIQCPEVMLADVNQSLFINYTTVNFGIRTPGSQMLLICQPGYARLNPMTCLANGSWDTAPVCSLVCKPFEIWCSLGIAATTAHANITYSDSMMVIYSYLNITCQDGYAIPDGIVNITCLPTALQNDTYWSSCPAPICQKQCPDLAPLANYSDPLYPIDSLPIPTYTPTTRTANATLTWGCGYSYVPSGNPMNITCYSNSITSANWTNSTIPYCFYLPPAVIAMILAANFQTMTSGELQTLMDDILLYYITTLDPSVMASLGATANDMIKLCTYDNVPCDITNDFKLNMDPTLGNCYRYNDDIPVRLQSNQGGPNRGLKLLLTAGQSEYMSKTVRAGYVVIFHTQKDTVFADMAGYSIAPGQRTNFALTYKRLTRLGSPYDTCTDTGGGQIFYYSTAYSQDGCWRSCLQYLLLKYCKCGDPRMPIPSGAVYCTTKQKDCMNGVTQYTGAAQLSKNCSCPNKCTDVTYSVVISTSKYPAVGTLSNVYTCGASFGRTPCIDDSENNNSLVYMYYGDMAYVSISEAPAYPILQLVIDIGSNVGLCLGMSAITIVELLKLLVEVLVVLCRKTKVKPEEQKSEKNPTDSFLK